MCIRRRARIIARETAVVLADVDSAAPPVPINQLIDRATRRDSLAVSRAHTRASVSRVIQTRVFQKGRAMQKNRLKRYRVTRGGGGGEVLQSIREHAKGTRCMGCNNGYARVVGTGVCHSLKVNIFGRKF